MKTLKKYLILFRDVDLLININTNVKNSNKGKL